MHVRQACVPTTRNALLAVITALIALLVSDATSARPNPASRPVESSQPGECRTLHELANTQTDASPQIAACLSHLAEYATLRLDPGEYHLRTPLAINRSVTIETGLSNPDGCRKGDSSQCAVLVLDEMPVQPARGIMPIEITAPNVTLHALAIVGSSARSAKWEKQVCLDDRIRPLGGGIRVKGTGFRLQNALIRGVSCYTGMEIVAGAEHPAILTSTIGPNGSHDTLQMWADGVTIHDTSDARVESNLFHDNTDVQLIFGGCRNCIVRHNVFRHSTSFVHASFAELMLHAWPNSSGDFSGSTTSENDIDCGLKRLCGYGIMIGGEPWYPARTSGGTVSHNRIARALVALNVDRLTGPMAIMGNSVSRSGGPADSDCGSRNWPAVNISPASVGLARTDTKKFASMDTTKCILLRHP